MGRISPPGTTNICAAFYGNIFVAILSPTAPHANGVKKLNIRVLKFLWNRQQTDTDGV